MPALIAQSGPLAGRRFEFDDEVVLGRENATITLDDEQTSRRHAAIRVVADAVVIEDLGSTNGTFVDGRRIDTATKLTGGETIKLGKASFSFELEPPREVDPGATRVADILAVEDRDRTALRAVPPAPKAPPRSAPAPKAPPASAPPLAAPARNPGARRPAAVSPPAADAPFAAFPSPRSGRRSGAASRKLGPTLVSFATIIATAAALIVYFAGR